MPSKAEVWIVHYFDDRLNRSQVSRGFLSEDEARYHACDLMRAGRRVDSMHSSSGQRVGAADLVAWCKSHRTPERPAND